MKIRLRISKLSWKLWSVFSSSSSCTGSDSDSWKNSHFLVGLSSTHSSLDSISGKQFGQFLDFFTSYLIEEQTILFVHKCNQRLVYSIRIVVTFLWHDCIISLTELNLLRTSLSKVITFVYGNTNSIISLFYNCILLYSMKNKMYKNNFYKINKNNNLLSEKTAGNSISNMFLIFLLLFSDVLYCVRYINNNSS